MSYTWEMGISSYYKMKSQIKEEEIVFTDIRQAAFNTVFWRRVSTHKEWAIVKIIRDDWISFVIVIHQV